MPTDPARASGARDAWIAFAAYTVLTVVLTWPVARGLARDVPSDFGDPLLNSWILAWDAEHLLRAAAGHPGVLAGYWHANIYYPHPYALAYSEHLTAQAIEILPVFATTRNPLLCYNLLFLSTFALSGLGMYLLARDLTSDRAAAFVAGLAFAFAPYRFGSLPHVQVLSSAWMPFTLLGLRRFFVTGRTVPLVGASVAWLAQNLSCSYYLIFFSPVVALYVAWELTTLRLWPFDKLRARLSGVEAWPSWPFGKLGARPSDVEAWRTLVRIAAATAFVVLATLPFVAPYSALRRLGFMPRSIVETSHFGADVYAYLTADSSLRVWRGVMQVWPRAEAWLFPGITITVLAAIAIVASWWKARTARLKPRATTSPVARGFSRALSLALIASCVLLVALLFGWSLRLPFFHITNLDRVTLAVVVLAAALLGVSARARATALGWFASPVGIFTIITLFAIVMSFGPRIYSRGRLIAETNLYTVFYDYVPGFDGLRVPARFGMIVALGLSALAGCGASIVGRLSGGRILVVLAGALVVVESLALPVPVNGHSSDYSEPDLAPLPGYILTGDWTPPVYRFAAGLPASDVIIELPFGEVAHEARYMFYSTTHWHRLVNGYSGGAPAEYGLLRENLSDMLQRSEPAWRALTSSGATIAIVHEGAYADGRGAQVSDWVRGHGGREIASFDGDRVFALP